MIGRFVATWLLVLAPVRLAALVSMGALQALVLRRHVTTAGRWVWVNVWVNTAAWLVGVMIPVAALSLAPDASPPWSRALLSVAAAVAMGVTVGLLTTGPPGR